MMGMVVRSSFLDIQLVLSTSRRIYDTVTPRSAGPFSREEESAEPLPESRHASHYANYLFDFHLVPLLCIYAMSPSSTVDVIVEHIRTNLAALPQRPLFVALQGPQGSGKTYTASRVAKALEDSSVRTATLSIDDLYLPHDGLVALASSHPDNSLLHGRGQPGTHDVTLGARVLAALRSINETGETVRLPAFDKSRHGGEGDRVSESAWTPIKGPLDVVLLEGWCVGFYPQTRADIEKARSETPAGLEGVFDLGQYTLEQVLEVNNLLAEYVEWWNKVDVFVQVNNLLLMRCALSIHNTCRSGLRLASRTCIYTSGAYSRSMP